MRLFQLLQMPEGLKQEGPRLAKIIEKTGEERHTFDYPFESMADIIELYYYFGDRVVRLK